MSPGRLDDRLARLLDVPIMSPTVVHVTGPRGSGRTFHLDLLAAAARGRRLPVVHIAGSAAAGARPFAIANDLLAAMPDPPTPFDALAAHPGKFIGRSLAAFVGDGPGLVLIDDLDLADPDSHDALSYAIRNLSDERVVVVTAGTASSGWSSARATAIRLEPLGEHELVATLVGQGVAEVAARRCAQASGGNPGLAIAIVAGLTDPQRRGLSPLPPSPRLVGALAEHLRDQLERLDERIGRALVVAAIDPAGNATVVRRVLDVLGEAPSGLDEAEAAGLVSLVDGRVVFLDPWTAVIAPSLVAPASRRAAHRALAAVYERPDQAASRAWHLAAAADGPDEQVANALTLLAHDHARRGAFRAASETACRAADLAERPDSLVLALLDALWWSLDLADVPSIRSLERRLSEQVVADHLRSVIEHATAEARSFLTGAPNWSSPTGGSKADRWEVRRTRRAEVEAAIDAGNHRRVLALVERAEYDPLGDGLSTVIAWRHRGDVRRSWAALLAAAPGGVFTDPARQISPTDAFGSWIAWLCAVDLAILQGRGEDASTLLSTNTDNCPARLRDWARVLQARVRLQQDPTLNPRDVPAAFAPIGDGALASVRECIEVGVRFGDRGSLERATELATRERLPVEAAEARMWALALRPSVEREAHLALTAAALQRCGVSGWSARITTSSVVAPAARPADPAVLSLSPAERRVAEAVASGLSNRDAATALIVSVKTIDFHLQQIYRKLGIRSRTELAIRMMNSEPTSPHSSDRASGHE
jgi:DNA-binding CsgD family transcriptional regulator